MANQIYEKWFVADSDLDVDAWGPVIEGGETEVIFEIDFPPEGTINKLVVFAVSGQSVDFKVDLFNRYDVIGGDYEALAKIIDTKSSTGGVVSYLTEHGGYPYLNQDRRTDANARLLYARKIYMRIVLMDGEEEESSPAEDDIGFAVSIACEPSQGG